MRFGGTANGALGGGRVRHAGGQLDQALDAPEALGERPDSRLGDERRRRFLRLHEEGDHAAEVAHLARRDHVLRVLRGGIEHPLDSRMTEQVAGHRLGVVAVLSHPHGERLHAAKRDHASRARTAPSDF